MSRGESRISAERLEAYLDDRLSPEGKAEFETQLSADAEAGHGCGFSRHTESISGWGRVSVSSIITLCMA